MTWLKPGGVLSAVVATVLVLAACGGAEELFQSVEERVAEAGAADLGVPQIEIRQAGTAVGSQFDFGAETVGQSRSLDFQIWNVGTGTLNLTGSEYVEILGPGFDCTRQPPASGVPAGESVSFEVTFSPTVADAYEATMSIASNSATSADLAIDLVGTGSSMTRLDDVTSSLAGGTYHATQTVTLSHAEPDVTIFYDVHAHGGNASYSEYPSGTLISIDQNQEVSAFARKDGHLDSNPVSFTYTLKPVTPVITLPGGVIGPPPQTVSIATSTGSTTIHYTIDGSTPDQSDTEYPDEPAGHAANGAAGVQLSVEETTFTIHARAYRSGWDPSDVAGPVSVEVTGTLATPSINWTNPGAPDPATFIEQGQAINFTSPDTGVIFRSTLNGSMPTSGSTSGSSVTINGYHTTVSVRAFKDHWNPSSTATQEFRIPIYETHSVTLDGAGRYNAARDKFYGTSMHGTIGQPMIYYMHRYSASTGSQEAVDDTPPQYLGSWLFNDGNIVVSDMYDGTNTEYRFTGSALEATGKSGGEVVNRNVALVEGDDYLYHVGYNGWDHIYLFSKTTLARVADRDYDGLSSSLPYVDFGGTGSGKLYITGLYYPSVIRLDADGLNETSFALADDPSGLKVLESPEGTYVFVRLYDLARIDLHDENGTLLASIPDLGELATKDRTYPGALIVEDPDVTNKMRFYRINTDID